MKNADQPINPIVQDEYIAQGERILLCSQEGLTKREYFAGLAMQGLLSSFTHNAANGFYGTEVVVSTAIEYADELLKQLENENN